MSLHDVVDLHLAFDQVWADKSDDAWPDVVGYRDFRRELEEQLPSLAKALEEPAKYQARVASCVEVPKKGFLLRPGVIPCIQDRIAYQALANLFAHQFEMEPTVYSNRLSDSPSRGLFQQGVRLWKEFQDEVERLCDASCFVVETDLTAYFEHIDQRRLYDRLGDVFGPKTGDDVLRQSAALLKRLFGRWNVVSPSGYGLPQINDASSFFANVYLDEVDKWLRAHDSISLRYVDDIRIFASSEGAARRALADLITKLRGMGLYVASAKTRICSTDEVIRALVRRRKLIDPLENAFESRQRKAVESIVDTLEDLFLSLVEDPAHEDDRLLRYTVNRVKRLRLWGLGSEEFHHRAAREVLARMSQSPDSTNVFIDYLSLFTDEPDIHKRVLDFMYDPLNVYPWQQMHLLELLIRFNLNVADSDRANQVACQVLAQERHPASRAKAIVLRGKVGTYADRRDVRDMFENEENEQIRRAILVGTQELQDNARDHFYRKAENESQAIRSTVGYIRTLAEPTYHYYVEPHVPDLHDKDSDDLYDLGSDYFL